MNLAFQLIQQQTQSPQPPRGAASNKPADLSNNHFDQSLAQADHRNAQQLSANNANARSSRASRTDRQNDINNRLAKPSSSEKSRDTISRRKADQNQSDRSSNADRLDDHAQSTSKKTLQHTENSTNNSDFIADSDAEYATTNAESSRSEIESASADDQSANFAGSTSESNPDNANPAKSDNPQSSTGTIPASSDQSAQNILALTAQNNAADAIQNKNTPATDSNTTPSNPNENTTQSIQANQNPTLQNNALNTTTLNSAPVVDTQIQNKSLTNAIVKNAKNQNIAANSPDQNTAEQSAESSKNSVESQLQLPGLEQLDSESLSARKPNSKPDNLDANTNPANLPTQASNPAVTELPHAQSGQEPQKISILNDTKNQAPQQLNPSTSDNQNNVDRVARGLQTVLSQRGGTVSLRLEPPELGVLKIQMEIQNGVISARFTTQTEAARNLLTHEMGQLRHALETRGLTIEGLDVRMQSTNQNTATAYQPNAQNNADDGRSRGQFTNQQNSQNQQNNQPDDAPNQSPMNFRDQLNMVA